jgi:predicted amidohydrolase YtcJ
MYGCAFLSITRLSSHKINLLPAKVFSKIILPLQKKAISMKNLFIIILFSLLFFNSCNMSSQKIDLLVYNSTIYTVDNDFLVTDAMAIDKGKILATGTYQDLKKRYEAKENLDAKGMYIYPGFYDAHCHFSGYGINLLTNAGLVGTQSFDEVIERVNTHFQKYPSKWILGRGWDQNDWEDKRFPDNKKLNRLFPDNPVVLRRIDGHALIANQKALELAKIDGNTKIDGGEILKKDGQLTGVLIDNAMDAVLDIIPKPDEKTIRKALLKAQEDCFARGLTSVADAGLDNKMVQIIDKMQQDKQLKMRVYAMLSPTAENLRKWVEKGIYKTPRLNVRSIKLYGDGALGSRGAKLIKPYSDHPETNGLLLQNENYFRIMCQKAYNAGYQVNTHAIGDSANRLLLNIYGEFLKEKNDRRWRIEHAQVIDDADFELFAKYSIVPSVQPTHATSDMYWAEDRLGKQRIHNAYAYQKLLQQNEYIALGTDFPIEEINPLYTFYAAVARKDLHDFPKGGFQMKNALTRQQSLKGMTIWAAKAAFEENEKGSLERGKVADFVILDKDIMKIKEGEIPHTQVIATYSEGELVFSVD